MLESRALRASVRRTAAMACMSGLAFAFSADSQSRVTTIVFNTRTQAYGGAVFGNVGPYEQLEGIATGEIDPKDPANAVIQDIELAPRNARGMVEYSTMVSILKPMNMSSSNRAMLLEIVNRGNKAELNLFNVGVTTTPPNPQGD